MPPIITLLTDFGTADGYVAEMKGVILSALPTATLVDAGHDVLPQDVEGARLAVARYWRRFPPGTVHLVVVDPDVGGERAALAVRSDDRLLVGPDNGVLSPALLMRGALAVALPVPATAAATFHGRDVFAPAAASLAAGTPLEELGAPHESPLVRRTPEPRRGADGAVEGQVIAIDRFGNAITNCLGLRGGTLEVAGARVPVLRTYADGAPGEVLALCGSSGLIEVAVRDGSAAARLGLTRGAAVRFFPAAAG